MVEVEQSDDTLSGVAQTSMTSEPLQINLPTGELTTTTEETASIATASVVFLTINDVYELFPNANGQGGIAEFATLLAETKAQLPPESHVIVTLNGDFLWRSELDRKDKGAHMIELLNLLGIEYVVLGNHEFDFGTTHLLELLECAKFTVFGSNIRQRQSRKLLPNVVDTLVLPLAHDMKLGLFGVSTTVTGEDPFAGEDTVFESEIPHAQRCVQELRSQGADVIVALTHFKVKEDCAIVNHVPGIDLILGGHDHEPMSRFVNHVFIHKSGQDALWLGQVMLSITKQLGAITSIGCSPSVRIEFDWKMLCNRGYRPDAACLRVLQAYAEFVERDEAAHGNLELLAISKTLLDGTRSTCRTQESNLGNMITDAMRQQLQTDVAVINAGYIKGDALHDVGLEINMRWLAKYLPLPKPTVVVELSVGDLKSALLNMLRRYPDMNSSHPQVSGLRVVYDVIDPAAPKIISLRLYKDDHDEQELVNDMDRMVTVAMPLLPALNAWKYFSKGRISMENGPMVRELVAEFLKKKREIAYPLEEQRLVIIE